MTHSGHPKLHRICPLLGVADIGLPRKVYFQPQPDPRSVVNCQGIAGTPFVFMRRGVASQQLPF